MNPSNSLAPKHSSILAGGDRDDDNFSCATVRASNVTQEKKYQVAEKNKQAKMQDDDEELMRFTAEGQMIALFDMLPRDQKQTSKLKRLVEAAECSDPDDLFFQALLNHIKLIADSTNEDDSLPSFENSTGTEESPEAADERQDRIDEKSKIKLQAENLHSLMSNVNFPRFSKDWWSAVIAHLRDNGPVANQRAEDASTSLGSKPSLTSFVLCEEAGENRTVVRLAAAVVIIIVPVAFILATTGKKKMSF